MLERTTRANLLYDFYGSLLSDKQREFFELYYHDDWSLREIADKFEVSRQGVYDIIRRSEKSLEDFESKLALYNAYIYRNEIYESILNIISTSQLPNNNKQKIINLVQNLQMND